MDFAAIRNAAEAYKPAMVKFLRDMIAIPSESCCLLYTSPSPRD